MLGDYPTGVKTGMARTQAADYDQRRDAIMQTAARIYGERGFLGTSVAQIALACKTSKSLIFYYYPSKEDILFDVMDSHVQSLVEAVREIAEGPGLSVEKIGAIAATLMKLYAGAEPNQKVLLNELGNLPPERRQIIVDHQRQLLGLIDDLVIDLKPALASDKPCRRALVMMFFGMLNWTHTWFDQTGPLTGGDIAAMATTMFLAGISTS